MVPSRCRPSPGYKNAMLIRQVKMQNTKNDNTLLKQMFALPFKISHDDDDDDVHISFFLPTLE
jgi:hypothetical protein